MYGQGKWSLNTIPAFCVTLDRRSDRWKHFQSQPEFPKISGNLKKFIGVDGANLNIAGDDRICLSTKRNIINKTRRSHEELNSVGGVGCALSHIALWKYVAESEHDIVLIFEDDAYIPEGIIDKMNNTIKNSSHLQNIENWDILLLGCRVLEESGNTAQESDIGNIEIFNGTYAYIMTKHCARRLLEHVYPVHCHIDLWITIFKKVFGCRIVHLKEHKILHTDLVSEIRITNRCDICNVPTRYEKSHIIVNKIDWGIARIAEVAILIMLIKYLIRKL